jgi:hypothetical protein
MTTLVGSVALGTDHRYVRRLNHRLAGAHRKRCTVFRFKREAAVNDIDGHGKTEALKSILTG